MAEQMVQSIKLGDAVEGKKGSTLVAERNKKALQVLRREIDAGKKKLAIFYGAAHMPDMSKRLMSEFDLVPASTVWLDAWKLARIAHRSPGSGVFGRRDVAKIDR